MRVSGNVERWQPKIDASVSGMVICSKSRQVGRWVRPRGSDDELPDMIESQLIVIILGDPGKGD